MPRIVKQHQKTTDPAEDLKTPSVSTPTPPPENLPDPGPSPAGDNPTSPSHVAAPDPDPTGTAPGAGKGPGKKRFRDLPETVRLLCQIWLVVLGVEIIHQMLGVVMSLLDTSALRTAARESLSPEQREQIPEALLNGAVTAGVVLMGLIAVALMGLLVWMIFLIRNRSRHAPTARRLLLVFGFYFAFRVLLIFMMTPGGSDVPVAMYAVDGSLQIIVGVGAVLALILGFRSETMKWTGEIGGDGSGDDHGPGVVKRPNRPDRQEK